MLMKALVMPRGKPLTTLLEAEQYELRVAGHFVVKEDSPLEPGIDFFVQQHSSRH
jgi:hypothetical protein